MKNTAKVDETWAALHAEGSTDKPRNESLPDGLFYTPILRTLSLSEILGLSETKRPVEEGE